jgi:hypothetical protein
VPLVPADAVVLVTRSSEDLHDLPAARGLAMSAVSFEHVTNLGICCAVLHRDLIPTHSILPRGVAGKSARE